MNRLVGSHRCRASFAGIFWLQRSSQAELRQPGPGYLGRRGAGGLPLPNWQGAITAPPPARPSSPLPRRRRSSASAQRQPKAHGPRRLLPPHRHRHVACHMPRVARRMWHVHRICPRARPVLEPPLPAISTSHLISAATGCSPKRLLSSDSHTHAFLSDRDGLTKATLGQNQA
jgi:hypothetical protein